MKKMKIYFNRWFSVTYHYMNAIRDNEDGMEFEIYGTHPDPDIWHYRAVMLQKLNRV